MVPEVGAIPYVCTHIPTVVLTSINTTSQIRIHLIDSQVVKRTGGRGDVMPYEKVALKDVVWLNTNEQVHVIARYAPWNDVYMVSCTMRSP
jgi:FtsP/CotA-like multicopper oxidase with cupredoxin domain